MLDSYSSASVRVDASSGIGIYKSHPLSYIVEYQDIVLDTNTLDYYWVIWDSYKAYRYCRNEINRIPVVVLQVVTVDGTKLAEVVKKTDYNNQTFDLRRNID